MSNETDLLKLDTDIRRVKTRLPKSAMIQDIVLDASDPSDPVVVVIKNDRAPDGRKRASWTPEQFRCEFVHLLRE